MIPVVPFFARRYVDVWRGAGVVMLPVCHNWRQLEMGGSMHTNATKASPQDAGIHHSTEHHEGLTLFSDNPRHEGLSYPSNIGDSLRQELAFTGFLGHASTTESEAPKLLQHK